MRGPLWSDGGKCRLRIQRALDACTGAEFSHSLSLEAPLAIMVQRRERLALGEPDALLGPQTCSQIQ